MAPNPHRLPRDVVPGAYRIDIAADLDAGTFAGTVSIDATAATDVETVVCNSADLDVIAVRVDVDGTDRSSTHRLDPETERLLIDVVGGVAAGPLTVEIDFAGRLDGNLVGFYTSTYDVDGDERRMAVTQFEAPYARRAFPCWDEPDFKATFEIALTCDAALTAVSNAPETARTDLGDGRVRVEFAPTMVMSTYLVAWVIGDLEVSETVHSRTTPIRVLHRPGQARLTAFALDCARHAVDWYEEYYGIDHPGEKLDLVAVPDFAFGAMENLGCVTFRENLLLVDPDRANRSEQERAATVIEHEIAHMWFGDLVTMTWWNGIWLNEAFATFMEFSCADDYRPDWEIWTSFGLSKSAAFDTDALAHTRPIEFEVATPADAEAMFDILTYEKGASVLRMFERWAGGDRFRDGVRRYLTRHAYANTDTADLWAALSEATGVDVGATMDTWILQGGHPVVTARVDGTTLVLGQDRFSYAGGDDADAATWLVPLRVTGVAGGEPFERSILLDGDGARIELDGPVEWANANAGFDGFYRTHYDATLRAGLLARVDEMASIDRYALVDDAWALYLADRVTLTEVIATLRAVAAVEDESSVWRCIAGIVGAIASLAGDDGDGHASVARLARALVGERLAPPADGTAAGSSPGSSRAAQDLRAVLFRLAGTVGDVEWVIDEARGLFAGLPGSLADDPELGSAVLDVVAHHGGDDEFDRLVGMFRDADTPQDELRALGALAHFPDAGLAARLCEMCRDEVRPQNAPYTLAQAMGNRRCGPQVWRFVAEHWDELTAKFPSSSIIRMAGGVRAFSDPALVDEVHAFFAQHPIAQADLALEQHLERLRVNAATHRRIAGELAAALR